MFTQYIFKDLGGEFKGAGKKDKYKSCTFTLSVDGRFECYKKRKCVMNVNLLKQAWENLQRVSGIADSMKYLWQFQSNGKTYNLASVNENERTMIITHFQAFHNKQATIRKTITESGKYNRHKPSNDDFKELQQIFQQSISNEFTNTKVKNVRSKHAATKWKELKKDPNWKIELFMLKEYHLSAYKNDLLPQTTVIKQHIIITQEEKQKEIITPLLKSSPTPSTTNCAEVVMACVQNESKDSVESVQQNISDVIIDEVDDNSQNEQRRRNAVSYSMELEQKDSNEIINEIIIEESGDINEQYAFSMVIEKKGKRVWSQYIDRELKMTNGAVLEFYQVVETEQTDSKEEDVEKTLMGITDLIEEGLIDVAINDKEGNTMKFGWKIVTNTSTYFFASKTENERKHCVKYIKYYYEKSDRLFEKKKQQELEAKKKEEERLRREEEKRKRELAAIAMREENKKRMDEKKRKKRIRGRVDAAVEKTSIFGHYPEINSHEMNIDHEQDIKDDIINANPLISVTLNELININTYQSALGSKAACVDDMITLNNDLIVCNQYCQIAIGKSIIRKTENDELECIVEQKYEQIFDSKPDIIHGGLSSAADNFKWKSNQQIDFVPNDRCFTLVCEMFCENVGAGNSIFSNDKFELIAPRMGSKRIAVRLGRNADVLNVGRTELYQELWYHIVIVCYRSNDDDEMDMLAQQNKLKKKKLFGRRKNVKNIESTDFRVFVNGVFDGKISFPGVCDVNGKGKMGKLYAGEIKNIQIFYNALTDDNIYGLYRNDSNMSYSKPILLTYVPDSLKVQIPNCCIKYNGNIGEKLPKHMNFQPKCESFTITAWILCSRTKSKYESSVIVSNMKKNGTGFELIAPTYGSNVIGLRYTGSKNGKNKQGIITVGTTKIITNQFYHVGVTIKHVINSGSRADATLMTVFLNGKADGSHNIKKIMSYSGDLWSIGINKNRKTLTRFNGSISNLRIFTRALDESEIACIYAADIRERKFKKNEKILYLEPKKNKLLNEQSGSNSHIAYFKHLQWSNGIFLSEDVKKGSITIMDNNNKKQTMLMSTVIKTANKISTFVPGTDSQFVTHLGGMIYGTDFYGNKWRIYSSDTGFLRSCLSQSCLSQLCKLKPFPKHEMDAMINNKQIPNRYILNRLLYSAFHLLKYVNKNKKNWSYFNEYILPFKLWKENNNFELLKEIAKTLQFEYKQMQFDLFNELKLTNWSVFEIKNWNNPKIINRQDGFDGGMTIEINPNSVGKELAEMYDKQVATHNLWGRCICLNNSFQKTMKEIFKNGPYQFHAGPPKTYERMVEKALEYQEEGAKFPAAYRICDVLRCSIECKTLNDITLAFNSLKDNITIVRIKNRFLKEFDSKQTDGYRDMLINVLFSDTKSNLSAICEVQIHLKAYVDIKKKQHKYYKIVRALDYKSLLRNYEARKFD